MSAVAPSTAGVNLLVPSGLSYYPITHKRHLSVPFRAPSSPEKQSSVVTKFKIQIVRSAATVALPTTTGAHATGAAAERDPIFSAPNLGAGVGFFAAATPVPQGEVEGGVATPIEGGVDGEAQVERPARRQKTD